VLKETLVVQVLQVHKVLKVVQEVLALQALFQALQARKVLKVLKAALVLQVRKVLKVLKAALVLQVRRVRKVLKVHKAPQAQEAHPGQQVPQDQLGHQAVYLVVLLLAVLFMQVAILLRVMISPLLYIAQVAAIKVVIQYILVD
jgi:hypothetical protein